MHCEASIKKIRYHIIVFGMFAILFFISADAFAEFDNVFRDDPNAPWHITAEVVEYDGKTAEYTATGNVTITRNDKKLSADFVRFNSETMETLAEGQVMMTAGEDILTGSRIEIDLKSETGIIYNASIFLKESHFYIKGNKIEKVGRETYTAHKASISACDGDVPAWKITGKNLNVTIDGYAVVRHAALWAKKVPVIYTPFFFFPVKLKRQTGLLTPGIGHSDRKGAEFVQPFYWAINESSDATFYLHYMEKRGNKMGLEYRYVLDRQSKGALMFDFLNDRKQTEFEIWDSAFRIEDSDRYWFRMKHDQAMPFGLFGKIDIDMASDGDYLHEFRDGYTGFDKTEAYFSKTFGRELDDYNDPVRVSSVSLNKIGSGYSLNAGARWYDDTVGRNTVLHKLPFIRFNALKQTILKTPFYWTLDSEYTFFYKADGPDGHRADVYPRFFLPKRFGNYATLEPSVGLRETVWLVSGKQQDASEKDTFSREQFDIRVELFSKLFKVFQLKENNSRIRHTIKPQITYEYIPDQNQDEYPYYDSSDRIGKKNMITYSVTNSLTTESETGTRRFCRFRLKQSYDISEAGSEWADQGEKQPFSPLFGEIELTPASFLSMYADAEWSPYENVFQSRNLAVSLSDTRGDSLFATYRYEQGVRESVYTDLRIKVSDTLSAYADYERNLYDRKDIKKSLGFLYSAQCWSLDIYHAYESGDHKYAFMVNLNGLGGVGTDK